MRETVRAKTTNQPTNRAPNEPARPICAQESIFWAKNSNVYRWKQKFWYHVTEKPPRHFVPIVFWSGIGANGPKMQNDHKCIIWAKFARLWAKNSNFLGGSKSFGTHVTEKPPRHLVCIIFSQAWDQMGQKRQNLAQNVSYGPNLAVLGPKFHWGGMEEKFWHPNIRKPIRHIFRVFVATPIGR